SSSRVRSSTSISTSMSQRGAAAQSSRSGPDMAARRKSSSRTKSSVGADFKSARRRRSAPTIRLGGNGPLSHIKVLDFTFLQMGSVVSMWLGDLGADVIKIERPDGGDLVRKQILAVTGEQSAPLLGP